MKKFKGLFILVCILMIALVGCKNNEITDEIELPSVDSLILPSEEKDTNVYGDIIPLTEVKEMLAVYLKVEEDNLTFIDTSIQKENGESTYILSAVENGTLHYFEINAETSEILEYESKMYTMDENAIPFLSNNNN